MAIVSFWGPVHGQVSTTSNLIATASLMALENPKKIMITQTQWSHSTLESAYIKKNNNGGMLTFSDTGLDALERLARSGRLTSDKVSDYTVSVLKDRLDLLVGSTKPSISMFENIGDVLDLIFSVAKQCYETCFIDCSSGTKSDVTKRVLEESDLIVVNLNQNMNVLERFFSKEDYLEVLDRKPVLLVLSKYDTKSRYSVKNIQRRFNYNKPIFTIPYNTDFRDACNQQDVIDFFLRAKNFPRSHEGYPFMSELRKLVNEIDKNLKTESNELVAEGVW